jgi:photosystem II stability/assembly factor-like uncharacterized protein
MYDMQRFRLLLFMVVVLILVQGSSFGQWVPTGFPQIEAKCLAAKDGILFGGTWGYGVYRSTDNGATWTVVNNGLPDFYARWVYALAVVPSSSGVGSNLFAAMEYGGVFRSTDDGANWVAVNSGFGVARSFVTLGFAGSTLLAGCAHQLGSSGVYRSVDDGGSWTICNRGFTTQADSDVEAFASITVGATTYFYAGTGDGVFISTTDGTSWTRISNGLPIGGGSSALAVNPGSGGIAGITLFTGIDYNGIYRSTDNGANWSATNDGLPNTGGQYIDAFKVSPAPVGTVNNVFAVSGVVYVSTNNGVKWWDTGWPYSIAGPATSLTINGDYLFAGEFGSFGGIWKYSLKPDTGWVVQQSGTSDTLYSVKAINDNVVWTAGTNGGIFRTTNGGAGWTSVGGGTIGSDGVTAIEPLDANIASASTSSSTAAKIFKTTNGGANWSLVYNQTGGFIDGIQMKSALEGYSVGSPVGGKWAILKTTDAGNTWARLTTEPTQIGSERGLLSVQFLDNTLWFGTTSAKVYRSTDLGATWTSASTSGSFVYDLHFNSPTVGLIGFNGGILNLSTDSGTSWDTTHAAGSRTVTGISGLGTEFWATIGGQIAYTNTNGQTWQVSSPGFTGIVSLWAVSMAPVSTNVNGWAVGEDGIILHYSRNSTSVETNLTPLPKSYVLEQNYPNPFNPSTSIKYSIVNESNVKLLLFNSIGQLVKVLFNSPQPVGNHEYNFNASLLPSGVYFYRIEANSFDGKNNFASTKKMILLK